MFLLLHVTNNFKHQGSGERPINLNTREGGWGEAYKYEGEGVVVNLSM